MSVVLGSESSTVGARAEATLSPRVRPRAHEWLVDLYWRRKWVFVGLLVAFYAAGFTGRWQPEPDSALYLSLGRNLAEGEGYTYLGDQHALAYPGMPYLIAGTFAVFGIGAEWAPHIVIFLLTLVGLGLLYRLFHLHLGPRPAVFLTCMVGMSFTLFRYAFELRNDVPFAVGVLGVLVGLESWRRRTGIADCGLRNADRQQAPAAGSLPGGDRSANDGRNCGTNPILQSEIGMPQSRTPPWYDTFALVVGLALAAVMRPHVWVLLGAMAVAGGMLVFRLPRRRAIVVGSVIVLLLAGGVMWIHARGEAGSYEAAIQDYVSKLATSGGWRTLGGHATELLDQTIAEAALGHRLGPGLTPVFGVVMAVLAIGLIRRRWVWGFFVLGTLAMVLVVLPAPRYLLPILPLLALAWWGAMVWVSGRLPARWGTVVFAVMLALWVVPNFLKITKLVAEQRSAAFANRYGEAGMYPALRTLAREIESDVPRDGYVLAHKKVARVLAYWSDRHVAAPYELPAAAHDAPLYVVRPMDEEVRRELDEMSLTLGPELARQSPTGRRAKEDWVLHELEGEPAGHRQTGRPPAPARAHSPQGSAAR